VSTPKILARKSEEGPLPYYKSGAESKGFNRPCSLVITLLRTYVTNSFIDKSYTIYGKMLLTKMFLTVLLTKISFLIPNFNIDLGIHVCNICYNLVDKNVCNNVFSILI
jgi:hypothetical protein